MRASLLTQKETSSLLDEEVAVIHTIISDGTQWQQKKIAQIR